ncbi:unnamed protein product [Rotaria socialis]|uniref:Fibronectin type-III domain-containing protein n=2 Tax=Rotaria socialis TaxID=392032 RepID=A0A821NX54_9BILA|nr:unnamed protein product [Rotaria socialis]
MEFKMSLTGKVIGHLISINDSLTRAIKIEDSLKTEFIFNNLSPANALFIIYDYILIIVLEHQFEFNGMHLNPFEQDNVFFIIFTTNHSSISYILNNLDGYTNYSCSISASSGCSNYCQSSIFMTEESDLDTTTPYAFILCAKARMGCGEASINRLLTTENRSRPVARYPPTISESSITSTSLILTWRKDYDFNYAPIRYDFASIGTNNRLKVLIKSLSNEHVVEKSYYLINENYSIRLNNICKNSYNMNETDALNVCLSNTSGDGPLVYAYYFHMQSSAPSHAFINSLNASVLSSTEILVQWNVFVRMI